jgi:carboxyvinyl-carboxyphosphonate phosphorylmutase
MSGADTGVDALFIVGLKNMAELSAVAAETKLPLILANAPGELENADLSPHKVRICLQGHLPLMAAVQSVYETMKVLRDGMNPVQIKNGASTTLMKPLTRAAYYDDATRNYLSV